MMVPVILEYVVDYFARFNSSTDAILTILQVGAVLVSIYFLAQLMTRTRRSLFLQLAHLNILHLNCWLLVLRLFIPHTLESSAISTWIIRLPIFAGNSIDSPFFRLDRSQEADDWRFQSTSTIVSQVNRARENFYVHARNLRIVFGIMRCIQAFLERQGYKGLQWSSDPHKDGGLCEPMADVFCGKVGRDIKLLPSQISFCLTAFHTDILFGCCTRKLKLNELHGVSKELLTFFRWSITNPFGWARSSCNDCHFQSLLSSDTLWWW